MNAQAQTPPPALTVVPPAAAPRYANLARLVATAHAYAVTARAARDGNSPTLSEFHLDRMQDLADAAEDFDNDPLK